MLGAPMSTTEALELWLAGEPVEIDLGYVPELDRYFLLWAGAGIDAEVMAGAEHGGKKKKWGYWAYIGSLAERLGGSRNSRIELRIEDESHIFEGHTVLAFNVNDLRFAGLQIGPVVDPHDGKMDLTVLTKPGVWGTLGEMLRVLTSGPRDARNASRTWLEASRVEIRAEPPLDVQADGEVIGRTPLTLEILPRALTVQAPTGYEGELSS
jgi:diacylglycerol kinase family enzyme